MIVIGVDVHKHSLTAVAVDELGRAVAERSGPVDGEVLAWACSLGEERLWAVEDCRHVTRGLEQTLIEAGRAAGAGAAAVDGAAAPARPDAGQVRLDRRAGGRAGGAAGAGARRPTRWRRDAARVEAAGRPPRRPGRRASSLPATAALAPARARPDTWRCRWGRSTAPSGSTGSRRQLARREQTTLGADRPRPARPLQDTDPLDRSSSTGSCKHARQTLAPQVARARRLRTVERRQAALRDRPDRPLPQRRAARPPRRRRTPRRQLRQTPTPPPRPRRQPPTQLRPAPNRHHPGPRPPTRTRLPRTQTKRRQNTPRSNPLPQTTARTHRLHNTQKRAAIDIGATLAQTRVSAPDGEAKRVASWAEASALH